MNIDNVGEMALHIARRLGVDYRLFSALEASTGFVAEKGGRASQMIDRELAHHAGMEAISKAKRTERVVTHIVKNVPEDTGKIEYRADLVVFNPEDFEAFLQEFAGEAVKVWMKGGGGI